MTKIVYASFTKFTLLSLCHELFFKQPFKDHSQVLQVLIDVLTKHEDIVKVYSHALVQQVLECQVHEALEGGGSIGKA